jgi:Na+/H+-dicarboxylate symporter
MLLNWRMAFVFGLSSLLATMQGMIFAMVFQGFLSKRAISQQPKISSMPLIALQCANKNFLQSYANGSLACVGSNARVAAFKFVQINKLLKFNKTNVLSLTQQMMITVRTMIPDNMYEIFTQMSVIGVCVFAFTFGIAVAKSHIVDSLQLLNILRQARNVMLLLLGASLRFIPVAIVSFMTTAVLSLRDKNVNDEVYIITGFLCGVASHVFFAMPLMVFIYTRTNPYTYMRQLLPAYVCAFGAGSSLAALPVAVAVMHQTGEVCRSSALIIQSIGTSLNLNGQGLYYPLMVVYLANAYGLEWDTSKMVALFLVTWLSCMTTTRMSKDGFVMLGTVFSTIFPGSVMPKTFALLAAIDFFFGRICSMASVHGNMMCVRILAPELEKRLVASSRYVQDMEEYRESRFVISKAS